MKSLLIVFAVFLSIAHSQQPGPYFPKILWTYWDSGFPGMSLFTQLCVNNMQHFSQKSGWEFRFLTSQNYTDFISEQSQIRMKIITDNSRYSLGRQNFADLIRLFLVHDNGGMWLDTNSFFLGDFSWIDHLDTYPLVYNRVSSRPEFLSFSHNKDFGGNKTNVTDPRTNKPVYLFPGNEIWSYISIPKSRFLRDTIDQIEYALSKEWYILVDELRKQGLQYESELGQYYLTSNLEFQTILQRKQRAIDAPGSNYTEKYAVEYYRMWSIRAFQSGYSVQDKNLWFPWKIMESLIEDSLEDITRKYKFKPPFFKFNGQFYPPLNLAVQYNRELICHGFNAQIRENSVMNVFMLRLSENHPEVQKMLNPSLDSCDKVYNSVTNFIDKIVRYGLLLLIVCVLGFCGIAWKIRSKSHLQRQAHIYSSMPVEDP